jgi:predicted DNA-binding transcriptional regulator AlpA
MPIPEFCRAIGISRALFYKMPATERPPVIRIGSKPLIRAADALEWLKNREAR